MPRVKDFDIYEELGSGAFGTVFKVKRNGTGKYLAMKRISLTSGSNDKREIDSQESIPNCKFVVSLVDYFFTRNNMYLVLDYCNTGTLNDYIVQKTVKTRRLHAFMRDMLSGLVHLHNNDIVHRDLKPDNIMLHMSTRGRRPICKLSDFGLARFSSNFSSGSYYDQNYYLQSAVGTLFFIAPEVLTEHYTDSCDVFSLGVVFLAILASSEEVHGNTLVATVDGRTPCYLASNKQIRRKVDSDVGDTAVADCIKSMLQTDYNKRIELDELEVTFRMATL